ncbi:DNA-processing protein DprA, partial [Dyadobacter psychrophilus]
MQINSDTVLKIMSLPNVGRKTAFKLLNALTYNISSDNDLIDFIRENANFLRNPLVQADFTKAFDRADDTINKSLNSGIRIINYYDPNFPILLKNLDDAPLLVNAKGNYTDLNLKPSVAIIGTRDPSDHGMKVGVRLGEVFGGAGFNVVSGLAIGCDTAGHTGCLNKFGYTTAVLAHGLDSLYPAKNKYLAEKILDQDGLLISEYTIGMKAQSNFFVERDRIQAGLSQAVIVVETDIKGGTMHTVKFAGNNKRIVATYNHDPKYLSHPKTQGNQYLIKNGTAKPLSTPESIENLKSTLLDFYHMLHPSIEVVKPAAAVSLAPTASPIEAKAPEVVVEAIVKPVDAKSKTKKTAT